MQGKTPICLQATGTSAQEISTDKFEQTEAIFELTPPQTAEEQDKHTEKRHY